VTKDKISRFQRRKREVWVVAVEAGGREEYSGTREFENPDKTSLLETKNPVPAQRGVKRVASLITPGG